MILLHADSMYIYRLHIYSYCMLSIHFPHFPHSSLSLFIFECQVMTKSPIEQRTLCFDLRLLKLKFLNFYISIIRRSHNILI